MLSLCCDAAVASAHDNPCLPLILPCRDGSSGSGAAAPAGGSTLGRGISFRGDSRWMGLAKAGGQDIVAGMTQSCQMYVAEFECR